jgi:hypothetical protein
VRRGRFEKTRFADLRVEFDFVDEDFLAAGGSAGIDAKMKHPATPAAPPSATTSSPDHFNNNAFD